MPWKESRASDERLKFIAEIVSGVPHCFNEDRPHQALLMQTPASLYHPTIRHLPGALTEIRYDERHVVRPVRTNGTIRWKSREVFITEVLPA